MLQGTQLNGASLSSEPVLLAAKLAWCPGEAGAGTWYHCPGWLLGLIRDPDVPEGLAVDLGVRMNAVGGRIPFTLPTGCSGHPDPDN